MIVPGIFLSIAFSLTAVVFLAENQRFSDAFIRSRDLVKGHWWYVLGCMLAVVIVPEIVIAIVEKVGGNVVGGILGFVLLILMAPLYVSMPVVMFRNLQSLKPAIEPVSSKRRWKYKLFILPFVLILLVLAIFFPFIFAKLSSIKFTGGTNSSSTMENPFSGVGDVMASSRDSRRTFDLRELKTLVSLYATTGDFSVCKANTLYASAPIVPPDGWQLGPNAGVTSTDGTGWLPFNVSDVTFELPVDPTNDPIQGLVYVMACDPAKKTFKFEAQMESAAYNQGGSHDVTSADGGTDPNLYEVGTDLTIVIPKYY